jgi:hypothetical protein
LAKRASAPRLTLAAALAAVAGFLEVAAVPGL